MIEQWKDVVGYEGYYQISDIGCVRSMRKISNTYIGKILKPSFKMKGKSYYKYVDLSKDGVVKTLSIHRLEAIAFLGLPTGDRCCVRHLDGNALNNKILNLKWGTYSENSQDSIRHGTFVDNTGSKHGMSKLRELDIIIIRQMHKTMTYVAIADYFKVSSQTIDGIIKGRTWKHVV